MEQGIQKTDTKVAIPLNGLTPEQIDLVKRTVANGATNDELQLFLYTAQKTGLDPLTKQIHFVKRSGKGTIQVGIDGLRAIAERSGKYAGNDDPVFDNEDKPMKATVTVYKIVKGIKVAITASARWSQYFPGEAQGFMWRKMPHLMLGKCAEALALRKAFPHDMSGLYIAEEMEQSPDVKVDEVKGEAIAPEVETTGIAMITDEQKQTILEGVKKLKLTKEQRMEIRAKIGAGDDELTEAQATQYIAELDARSAEKNKLGFDDIPIIGEDSPTKMS